MRGGFFFAAGARRVLFLLRVRAAFFWLRVCVARFVERCVLLRACMRRVLFVHARGVFFLLIFAVGAGRVFFAAGAGRVFCCRCAFFWLQVRGALFSVLLTRGAFFFYCGYAARFFCFGCAVPFSLYNAGAQRVFLLQASAGVWRGLFSSAGAAGGAVHGGWMHGEAGACVFSSGRGGQDEPGRRVYVFAAGARRVCLFFAAAAGGGGALRQGVRSCFFSCGFETGVRRRACRCK